MMKPIATKTITINGQEHEVRVFAPKSREPRDGRKAAINLQMDPQVRREVMADYTYATGHSPLSGSHNSPDRLFDWE